MAYIQVGGEGPLQIFALLKNFENILHPGLGTICNKGNCLI
jgi:hypothetical protein